MPSFAENSSKAMESTPPVVESASSMSPPSSAAASSGPSSSDMQYYYQYLYPFKVVFQWLNHYPKPQRDMINREFAMAFRSGAYKRYNSFNTVQEFKQQIQKGNPDRFEIGAVYNKPPRDRDSVLKTEMKPIEKELVFDIDMDDYDAFRTCCSGAHVCEKCWKFISLAIKVMNTSFEEDFGFQDFIWVFSGRRGAHCWISDKRARVLTDSQRRGMLDYMNVIKDRNLEKKMNFIRPYHPHLSRSLEILKPHFTAFILREQDPWQKDTVAFQTILPALHDKLLSEALKKYWTENPGRSSETKWKDIDQLALAQNKQAKRQDYITRLKESKEDLILTVLYPKLDIEVTKQTIHLLKAPFCIHPSTGNVCVPISENFTPSDAPKLITLQREMEQNGNNADETSLKPFISIFNSHVSAVMKTEISFRKREREDGNDENMDF
ncbi:HFR074Wp [Eremothecium sinecaudum]|uniref:DNA primase n=1 Tax=Eremothecium sinecaudum TaxID=45286 RepID=A0A0X8HUU0_9SACH|nr:HFR074Wp [Eremothecium sinecaudum]AMD21929.1 HFR074Wp [Eremothecium sinecaudum]